MDIVYVYKEGIDGGESLRLSLWSVERNCHYVDRVFIVGDTGLAISDKRLGISDEGLAMGDEGCVIRDEKNGWSLEVSYDVQIVKFGDRYNRKHKNIFEALMYVALHTDVGCNDDGVFMYSSDDHWYVQDFDCRFGASEVWLKGRLHTQRDLDRIRKSGKKPNNWLRSMVETRDVLNRLGYPTFDFSQHANTWFNAGLMREELFGDLFREAQESVWGLEPSCVMMNYWVTRRPYDVGNRFVLRYRRDFKVGGDWTVERFREEYEGVRDDVLGARECISGSDGVIGNRDLYGEVVRMINENE